MITKIYRQALAAVMKKPFKLWGILLLGGFLCSVMAVLFLAVPAVAIAINLGISTSITMIFLYSYRGQEPCAADLFECLKDGQTAKRTVGGMAWMALWIFLYGLIPVVGPILAIVKTYAYRLTPYILVLEPEIKITEAYKVSESRTFGYKGKMFGADFLAGVILSAIDIGGLILVTIGEEINDGVAALFALLFLVVNLFVAFVFPLFIGFVQAAFYEEIMGKVRFFESRAKAADPAVAEAKEESESEPEVQSTTPAVDAANEAYASFTESD